ncbi:MAG: HypC/HybG/HupF family hydrogenase formation chaperone [Candidatus Thermoplasmatota archaeon]
MCLAIPAKIIEKKGNKAIVDYGGVKREVDISLVNVEKGDYVIVHAGFAIQVIDEKGAKETIKIFEEILKNA